MAIFAEKRQIGLFVDFFPDRQGEISHHLASLGKYNSIVGIDQGGPETKISQLYQI